jgi:hypothetical protein
LGLIRKTIGDNSYLRRLNSIHRFNLRQIEKNRFPVKCGCVVCGESFLCRNIQQYIARQYYLGPDKDGAARHVCWGCGLKSKVGIAARTLYHLIDSIPVSSRDDLEIYPDDYREALIPQPLQSNWNWRKLKLWHRQGMLLCGVSGRALLGRDTLGLRDYTEPTKLLTRFDRYEFAWRQKAASPVRHILDMPGPTEWSHGCDVRLSLYALGSLKTPEEQRLLERIGRFYKNSCWFPQLGPRRLFDKCYAGSYKKLQAFKGARNPHLRAETFDAEQLQVMEGLQAAVGGVVDILIPGIPSRRVAVKRHTALAATRETYNERWQSCWLVEPGPDNVVGLSKTFRKNRSLNIPRETIEARDHLVANIKHNFGQDQQKVVA